MARRVPPGGRATLSETISTPLGIEIRMARVLVVDDAVFMRTVLRDILQAAGHEVVGEAATGEEAVERYGELAPDLVTLDLVMPGMGGREALRSMLESDPAARVLIVSAQGQREDVEEAIMDGAADFLPKPFDPDQVVRTVDAVLGVTAGSAGVS